MLLAVSIDEHSTGAAKIKLFGGLLNVFGRFVRSYLGIEYGALCDIEWCQTQLVQLKVTS